MKIDSETTSFVLAILLSGWAAYILIDNELKFRYRNKKYPFKK